MDLLLVRHGDAVDDAPGLGDPGRWLSPKGRKVTKRVARWLAESTRRQPETIWTSPLVRAVQTAEIFAAELGFKGEVVACRELATGGIPEGRELLRRAADQPGPVVFVGHEPSLSELAIVMLGSNPVRSFKKSGVLGVTWERGEARFEFFLDPETLKPK